MLADLTSARCNSAGPYRPTPMTILRCSGPKTRPDLAPGIQFADYIQYFTWQWAKSAVAWLQIPIALVFLGLGLRGSFAQRRADRSAWWLLFALFMVTGVGLVVYMNFKPGFGRWFDLYPGGGSHEVRERDYFFVVSFIVWGLWAGWGWCPAPAYRRAVQALLPRRCSFLAAIRMAMNWRRPSATVPFQVGRGLRVRLLNSVQHYGIVFTYGDTTRSRSGGPRRSQDPAGVTVVCMACQTDGHAPAARRPGTPADQAALPAFADAVKRRTHAAAHHVRPAIATAMMDGYVRLGASVGRSRASRTGQLHPAQRISPKRRSRSGTRPIVGALPPDASCGPGRLRSQRRSASRFSRRPDTTCRRSSQSACRAR